VSSHRESLDSKARVAARSLKYDDGSMSNGAQKFILGITSV
jgi:hypothetical protein